MAEKNLDRLLQRPTDNYNDAMKLYNRNKHNKASTESVQKGAYLTQYWLSFATILVMQLIKKEYGDQIHSENYAGAIEELLCKINAMN